MPARVTQEEWQRRADACGYTWLAPVKGSGEKTPARCNICQHEWSPFPVACQKGHGCPRCAAREKGQALRASQAQRDGEAAAAGGRWLKPCAGAHDERPFECLCGERFLVKPAQIQQGHGCRKCGYRRIAEGQRSPAEQRDAEAARVNARWIETPRHGQEPYAIECNDCGHRWTTIPNSVQQGRGCPRCGRKRAAQAIRLPRRVWDERANECGYRWLEEPRNTKTPTLAECLTCGTRSRPEPGNVASGGSHCRVCNPTGWKDTRPSVLYVVVNPDEGRVKIGKTGAPKARMNDHRSAGFTDLVWMSDEAPGYEVSAAEVAALPMVGVEPVQGREYFALSPTFLVADAVSVAQQAFDEATRQAKAA